MHGQQPLAPGGAQPAANADLERERNREPEPHPAVCLVLFLIFNYAVVATTRARAAVARGLLGPAEDPLREAKEVLGRPGPLSSDLRT